MEKILKLIFIVIGILIVVCIVIALLPLLIIGLILGLITGKLKVAQLNALKNRQYGMPNEEEINSAPEIDKETVEFTDGDIIDIKAEEVKEKQ